MLDLWGLGTGPQGLILECAELSTPIDASGAIYGTFTAGAMRARLPATPLDAPPLVVTSGSSTAPPPRRSPVSPPVRRARC